MTSRARRTARRSPASSLAALLLVGALLAAVLAGCSDSSATQAGPTTTDNGLPSLVLIGDSITHRSADVLMESLSDRYNVTIVAEDGRTIAEQQDGASEASSSPVANRTPTGRTRSGQARALNEREARAGPRAARP